MGWNVQLTGLFRSSQHPVSRFLEITRCFERSTNFSKLFSLTISDSDREPVQIFEPKNGLHIEQLQQILEPYYTRDCVLEGWWSADERYLIDRSCQKPLRTGYRVALTIPASEYTSDANLINSSLSYEIGDSSLFSPKILKETAHLNFEAVLQEIFVLSGLEVDKLQGRNIDAEQNPGRCFLMYHHDPYGFGVDLGKQWASSEVALSLLQEDIQQIAQRSKEVDYRNLGTGVIVFHQKLIDGDLEDFYSTLKKFLETVSY
jgi:hypothetical protein